ncbi:MAG: hypothetical protein U0670_19070 [Anaerolineae bacterium]
MERASAGSPRHTTAQRSPLPSKEQPKDNEELNDAGASEFGESARAVDHLHAGGLGLTPGQAIALQRTIGNRAFTHALQRTMPSVRPRLNISAMPAHTRRKIQRLIGFEIESRIPVFKKTAPDTYAHYDYNQLHVPAGTGDSSELGIDKEGHDSIIEFVSAPVDDTQSSSNFRAKATQWVNVLSNLNALAVAPPFPKKLKTPHPGAPDEARFGKLNGTDSAAGYANVAIQATHGVALDQVTKFFSKSELQDESAGRDRKKNQALAETKPNAVALTETLKGIVDPSTSIDSRSPRNAAIKEAEGFFALVAHYLILGGKGITAYLKNQTTLFYKSKLSDVRTNLITSNRWAFDLLHYSDTRAQVRDALLAQTGRNGGHKLFASGQAAMSSIVTCQAWLDAVLSGQGDPFFDEAKNDWGKPIDPGKVAGKNAVVLEHRDLKNEMPFPENISLNNPNVIINYLVSVYKMNKKRQGL